METEDLHFEISDISTGDVISMLQTSGWKCWAGNNDYLNSYGFELIDNEIRPMADVPYEMGHTVHCTAVGPGNAGYCLRRRRDGDYFLVPTNNAGYCIRRRDGDYFLVPTNSDGYFLDRQNSDSCIQGGGELL